jgi:NADPH:quinone reductase-like Zn-dependent oxidoreductase
VVAAGRSGQRLERLRELGADATVSLAEVDNVTAVNREAAGGTVDVIIDMVWGDPAVAALGAAAPMARHVQLGHSAGPTITLSAPTVRSARWPSWAPRTFTFRSTRDVAHTCASPIWLLAATS